MPILDILYMVGDDCGHSIHKAKGGRSTKHKGVNS